MHEIIAGLTAAAEERFNADDLLGMAAVADELLLDDPKSFVGAFALGTYFLDNKKFGTALALFRYCESINPGVRAVAHNLSVCLADQHPKEALRYARRAYGEGDNMDFAIPLLQALAILGHDTEAILLYEKLLNHTGMDPRTGLSASFSYLRKGEWEKGWRAYATGEGYESRKTRYAHLPLWQPRLTSEARIVVYGEQGLGDELLFSVFLSQALDMMKDKKNRVRLEVIPKNKLFFHGFFGDRVEGVTSRYDPETTDGRPDEIKFIPTHRISLSRLPLTLKQWQPLCFDPLHGSGIRPIRNRAAIASRAGSRDTGDIRRSIPASDLFLNFVERFPDIKWECADYYDTPLGQMIEHPEVYKEDTMSIVRHLDENIDFVVCPTTSIADMCGAVGIPAFVMVDTYQPGWRYLKDNEWWTAIKSFHQPQPGNWRSVFLQVAAEIEEWTSR